MTPTAPMTSADPIESRLRELDITPTRQRLEIARLMLAEHQHLSADQIQARLIESGGEVPSRATVYNTLKLFAERGLLRQVVVDPQRIFFDSNVGPHHHYFNVDSGVLSDIELDAIQIFGLPTPPAGQVLEAVDVILRVRQPALSR